MTTAVMPGGRLATWMISVDVDLIVRTVRRPGGQVAEMPFINELPVGLPLTVAMGLRKPDTVDLLQRLSDGSGVRSYRYSIEHAILGRRHYALSAAPHFEPSGEIKGHHCSISDLTPTLELAVRQQRDEAELSALLECSPMFVAMKDLEGCYVRLNKSALAFLAPWSESPIGLRATEIFPTALAAEIVESDERVMESEVACEYEQDFLRDGRLKTVLMVKFPIFDSDGALTGIGLTGVDISERKDMESEIRCLAKYDLLTDLPNRRLCLERLSEAVALAQHLDQRVAAIAVDIDEFRTLNDTLGDAAGDQILIETVWRLRQAVPTDCTIARLGGDEFCIVVPALERHGGIERIVADIHAVFAEPVTVDDREIFVSVTAGAAAYPVDTDGPEQLIQCADMALTSAKKSLASWQRFSPQIGEAAQNRTRISSLLRRALDRGEFHVVYQPIVDAVDGEVVMLEALLRWESAELGPVGPATFIPIAEETGLIRPIGRWCLRVACRDAVEWNRQFSSAIGVAVNVSPRQLFDGGFVELVRATLAETGLPPTLLKIEITESSLVQDIEACKRILEDLATLGVTLALDDFGTGYSALSYLQQLRFHVLKLDQSFVRKIVAGEPSAVLTASIIAMASALGMKTVAEGVEHIDHLSVLRSQGCEFLQGYHFSKPLPWARLSCFRDGVRSAA